jgi:hypothetical protein
VYLINNIETRLQFRSVACAVLLGLIISADSVIVFFEQNVGTGRAQQPRSNSVLHAIRLGVDRPRAHPLAGWFYPSYDRRVAVFAVGGWSGLISRRVFTLAAVALMGAAALSIPFLLYYFEAQPGSFLMRFYLFEGALQGYWQNPFLGVGLNNATAAMNLVNLREVGPLGFILFFAFFGNVVLIALRAMREVAADLKPLLVGMVSGLASFTAQNLADDTLAHHGIGTMFWLFAALIIAIARQCSFASAPRRTESQSQITKVRPRPTSRGSMPSRFDRSGQRLAFLIPSHEVIRGIGA